MASKVNNQVVLQELAELVCAETAREIVALFPPGSHADYLRFLGSLDATQKLQFKLDVDRIHAQADKRFWQRARARGLNIVFPPCFSALRSPHTQAMRFQAIHFSVHTH
jgi:hypothetical protein